MKKYVIYLRKSEERDERQAISIQSQLEEIQTMVERDGLKIASVIRDECSAKYPGRPGFQELVDMLENGTAQGAIVWHLNRISRNAKDSGTIQWLIDSKDVEIRTINQIYTKKNSSLLFKIESGQAEQFSKDLSDVVKRSNRTHFSNGTWLGPAPQGYINDRDHYTGEARILKDPKRYDYVRKMWDLLLSEMYTPAEICRLANEDWKFTMRPTRHYPERPLELKSLHKIFRNEFYYGLMIREVDGEVMKKIGNHIPMVSKEEFDKAQEILGYRPRSRPPMDISTGLNGGLIRCGECGYAITFEAHKKQYKNGSMQVFVYARCSKKGSFCGQRYLPIESLNEQIEDVLAKLALDNEFITWALDVLRSENKNEEKEREELRLEFENRLRSTRERLNRLVDAYLEDPEILRPDEYKVRKAELEEQENKLREQLEGIHIRTKHWLETVEQRLNFAKDSLMAFKYGDVHVRKHIIQTIGGSNLKLKDGVLYFEPVNEYKPIYENSELLRNMQLGSP